MIYDVRFLITMVKEVHMALRQSSTELSGRRHIKWR